MQDKPQFVLAKALVKERHVSSFKVGTRSSVYWTLFVLSLTPLLACVVMWILILLLITENTHIYSGSGLGGFIIFLYLLFGVGIALFVSSLFSFIGLGYVGFTKRRFDRAFGWLLAVNVAMVVVPILGVMAQDWYEKGISLVRAVESGDAHRLEALLATRQRPPHPDEASLALSAAVEAGNIEMVDMLVRTYSEKWSMEITHFNTYEEVLTYAAGKKKINLMRTLLERGVDPNKCRFGFNKEKSLLDCEEEEAKRTNDWRTVQLLRSYNAK